MIQDQSHHARFGSIPPAVHPTKRPSTVALRRRLQSAFFPVIDAHYPALTHRLRLVYNVTLRRGEAELHYVRSLVDRGRAAVDIGAHRGIYAHVLAQCAKHVHAFEPHPQLFAYLRRTMPATVSVHPVALSSAAGAVTFRIPRSGGYLGLGQGTLETLPIYHADTISEIEVRRSTLDQEIKEPVGFIKIDVEGHELSVLEGGRELLRRDRPALIVEIADDSRLLHYRQVLAFLSEFGYRTFWLENDTLVDVESRDPTDPFVRITGPKGEILAANFIFLAEHRSR